MRSESLIVSKPKFRASLYKTIRRGNMVIKKSGKNIDLPVLSKKLRLITRIAVYSRIEPARTKAV